MSAANFTYPAQLDIGVRDRPGEVVKFGSPGVGGNLPGTRAGFGEQLGSKRGAEPIAPRITGRFRAPFCRSRARAGPRILAIRTRLAFCRHAADWLGGTSW